MGEKVILYTISTCSRCPIIKQMFDNCKVPYEEIEIDKQTAEEKGFEEMPILEVDGKMLEFGPMITWLQESEYYSVGGVDNECD